MIHRTASHNKSLLRCKTLIPLRLLWLPDPRRSLRGKFLTLSCSWVSCPDLHPPLSPSIQIWCLSLPSLTLSICFLKYGFPNSLLTHRIPTSFSEDSNSRNHEERMVTLQWRNSAYITLTKLTTNIETECRHKPPNRIHWKRYHVIFKIYFCQKKLLLKSCHEKLLNKLKLSSILQNNCPVLFKNIKARKNTKRLTNGCRLQETMETWPRNAW